MVILSRIKELAKINNIQLEEIAKAANITLQGLYKLIRENSTKVETLELIAKKIGVPITVFFSTEDDFAVDLDLNSTFVEKINENLKEIITDKNLSQSKVAEYAGVSASQFSRVLQGNVQLSLSQLSNIAKGLSMREIDIITYPDKYSPISDDEPNEVLLQIKLSKEKKDQVLKLVFGENNIEILNR